ncbi:MAG: rRNA maturation RNase YbeY [Endomicrobium sp.]|jgi:probable rRNA maturation factor|nr:rRNA maturation RNase YbeY [Endomicrobium sp.]
MEKLNINNFINFINFPKKYIKLFKKAAFMTLSSENVKKYRLNFIIMKDEEIKKLNEIYRKSKYTTDILSFLMIPKLFIGDIYISKNITQKQAKIYNNTWEQELTYLIIHGILHIFGYTDYDNISKIKMFNKQDEIFKRLFKIKFKNFKTIKS